MRSSTGRRLHLLGLIGPGGVHAVDEHLLAMVELATRRGLPADRVLLHAFTDGRDTAAAFGRRVRARPASRGWPARATVATVSGRYYAMDRDGRWERIAAAWEAIVHGARASRRRPRRARSRRRTRAARATSSSRRPSIDGATTAMRDDDAVVHLNFRADRARQLTQRPGAGRLRRTSIAAGARPTCWWRP